MDTPTPDSPLDAREFCLRALPMLQATLVGRPGHDSGSSGGTPQDPVLREIGDGLVVEYLVDQGGIYSRVQRRDLSAAGLDPDELHASAVANLAALADERCEVHEYGAIHAVLIGRNFEASLILMDEFWMDWVAQLAPTGFVVAFPAQDVLAFGDASSADAIRELQDLCTRVDPAVDRPLTDRLYLRTGDGWSPLPGQD